ncbi:glutathione S-transferase family protein [Nostoc sp. CHAB 5844]|nr:glutathione S-transferase family protein [Nostoc sp. CHAB 5844]
MLRLYHAPFSPNSRRVWITLLEKQLEFELVEVKLDKEQFQPVFLTINPFHHVPVLVDDGFNIVESLAILDYLEAKYSTPTMLPPDAKDLAAVRMVQLLTVNELMPKMIPLTAQILGLPGGDAEKIQQAQQQVTTVLKFFENLLDDRPYFGSAYLTLAEVVAGTIVPWLTKAGISFSELPKLSAWCDRLISRPSWQTTEPDLAVVKSRMAARIE